MTKNDIAFSFSDYKLIDEFGQFKQVYRPHHDVVTYKDILKHNCIGCSTAIYDVKKLGKVYMPENAIKREDLA